MGSIVNFSETSSQTMKEERNREDGVGSLCPGQVQVGPGRKTNSCSMYGSQFGLNLCRFSYWLLETVCRLRLLGTEGSYFLPQENRTHSPGFFAFVQLCDQTCEGWGTLRSSLFLLVECGCNTRRSSSLLREEWQFPAEGLHIPASLADYRSNFHPCKGPPPISLGRHFGHPHMWVT